MSLSQGNRFAMMHVDEAHPESSIELGKIEPTRRTGQAVSSNARLSGRTATLDLTLYNVSTSTFEIERARLTRARASLTI